MCVGCLLPTKAAGDEAGYEVEVMLMVAVVVEVVLMARGEGRARGRCPSADLAKPWQKYRGRWTQRHR
jgi:hypothetical protein